MNSTLKKLEELVSSNAKLAELLHLQKEEEEEKKNTALYVFAIIGAIAETDYFDIYDNKRSIVTIKKVKRTPMQYPRKAGTPSKNPL